jgi:hypothetical protein
MATDYRLTGLWPALYVLGNRQESEGHGNGVPILEAGGGLITGKQPKEEAGELFLKKSNRNKCW